MSGQTISDFLVSKEKKKKNAKQENWVTLELLLYVSGNLHVHPGKEESLILKNDVVSFTSL